MNRAIIRAFDNGYGRRCISHRSENPYDPIIDRELHDAYERGFQAADDDANHGKRASA